MTGVPGGIVLANKPAGIGSTLLTAKLKRELKIKRVGHAGTLDRFAEGLMILLVGKATPLADTLLGHDKTYRATFQFGRSTDTLDGEGQTLVEESPEKTRSFLQQNETLLQEAIAAFTAQSTQVPPSYSALKKDGKRMSDYAREGGAVEISPRPVRIYEAKCESIDPETGTVQAFFSVGSGTYIRSIARDLGDALNVPVFLSRLVRLSIGGHDLSENIWYPGQNDPYLYSPSSFLPDWKVVQLSDTEPLQRLIHGNRIALDPGFLEQLTPGEDFFIQSPAGEDLAWCVSEGGNYRYRRVFLS